MKKITLRNKLHNTEINLIPHKNKDGEKYISLQQIQRAEKALCGMDDCKCETFYGPHDGVEYDFSLSASNVLATKDPTLFI